MRRIRIPPYVDVTRGRRRRSRKKGPARSLPDGVSAPQPTRRRDRVVGAGVSTRLLVSLALALVLLPLILLLPRLLPFARHRAFGLGAFLVLVFGLWIFDFFAMKRRLWRRTKLRARARMRFGQRGVAADCPYCHEAFAAGGAAVKECAGCEAAYHADCLDELGGCATLGCSEARPRVRLTKPATKPGHATSFGAK